MKKGTGDLQGAEVLYRQAVDRSKPGDGEAAGAYAVFLHTVRQNYDNAQSM